MSNPFIGEIRMFGGNFAPVGWAFCNGQTLAISQNDALFALIGTTYGGDGQTTFSLPNLQSRVPIHQGQGSGLPAFVLGQMAGVESVTLLANQLGQHTHTVGAQSGAGNTSSPANATWAAAPGKIYAATGQGTGMHPAALSSAGGNQPHENMRPILCVSFIIALEGIFPTQN